MTPNPEIIGGALLAFFTMWAVTFFCLTFLSFWRSL